MKKRYSIECPVCGAKLSFAPSLAMRQFGMRDHGHGTCLGCKTFLHLEITDDDRGTAERWDEWLARQFPAGRPA